MVSGLSQMEDEQVREVNREREREREVDPPPKAEPMQHFLHPDGVLRQDWYHPSITLW
jgi:hypothetical protein